MFFKLKGAIMYNNRPIFEVFVRRRPAMMLVELRKTIRPINTTRLARKVSCTYSHTEKTLKVLESAELLNFKNNGKLVKNIHLTETGSKVAEYIDKIKGLL